MVARRIGHRVPVGPRPLFAALLLLAAAAHAAGAGELARTAGALPFLLWGVGRGWAGEGDLLERELRAVWISLVVLVPCTVLARVTGIGGWGLLGLLALVGAVGLWPARPRARPLPLPVASGAVAAVLLALAAVWSWRGAVVRPLEAYWYDPGVEAGWAADTPPVTGTGWRAISELPGGARAFLPAQDRPAFLGPFEGEVRVLLQGPVGSSLTIDGRTVRVEADVTERADEGPVPRYQDRGVASLAVVGALGRAERLPLHLSAPEASVVLVIPTVEAAWELHGSGLLRYVHYYQLLNMVEQLRWADELGRGRWVTDVQPPWWSWVLAGAAQLGGGGLVTANLLAAALLVLVGLQGVDALRAWAPHAPALAWLLPGAATVVHAKLLYEPGSAMMPDTLYTAAVLAALAALGRARSGDPRHAHAFARFGLGAQLARYPATYLTVALALGGGPRRIPLLLGYVAAAMVVVGGAGLATGQIDGWLATAWYETGPEHWHGDTDPAVLLGRVPAFLGLWLGYAGATPILAAVRWPPGTRAALGGALLYAALLATVDHHPSHYFLPLVHLPALALGISAGALRGRAGRFALPALGLLGLFISATRVAVT